MLIFLAIVIGLFLLLFLYSACVISSRCSRIEEQYKDYKGK